MLRGRNKSRIVSKFLFRPYINKEGSAGKSNDAGQLWRGNFCWRRHGVHLDDEDLGRDCWAAASRGNRGKPHTRKPYQDEISVKIDCGKISNSRQSSVRELRR